MKTLLAILFLISVASAQSILPDAPSAKQKHKFSKFLVLTASTAAVTAVDGWQTSQPGLEVGSAWLYGTFPSDHKVRLSLTMGAEVLVSTLAGRYLQHTRFRKWWWIPQSAVLGVHGYGMIQNFRTNY